VQIRIRVNAGFLGGFDKRENTNVTLIPLF
jgi:hypothetical protein